MRRKYPAMLAACAMLGLSMIFALGSFAQPIPSPPPIMPPSLPPSHSVDLMTVAGATALGAKWKVMEAKLVEVPAAPNAIPEYKTTHNIAPRANELEFGWLRRGCFVVILSAAAVDARTTIVPLGSPATSLAQRASANSCAVRSGAPCIGRAISERD